MEKQNYTVTFLVGQPSSDVFDAVINPRAWWSEEIKGDTSKVGDVFNYHFEDIHRAKLKIIEVVPNEKVVWLVLDNYFKPGIFNETDKISKDYGFENNKAEWIDTRIVFEIWGKNDKTHLRFTHEGLVPDYECYEVCSNGWTHYIQESLYRLIVKGKGQPNGTDRPMTADEERFKSENNS